MSNQPVRLIFDLGKVIKVSPSLFLENRVGNDPSDLSKFAPQGTGVYGYKESAIKSLFHNASIHESSGGLVYFGCDVTKEDFEGFLNMMKVKIKDKDYAVFVDESKNPSIDGYIVQIRIVSKFALRFMFKTINEKDYENFNEQKLNITETLWKFIEAEKKRWGTSFYVEKGLEGMFGGDGDFMREELAFGFMLENEYYGIYRIWSRAWLVTK